MVEWKKIGEVCKTITPPKKLGTVTYQDIGLYPIIDQGQNAIVGYTDDETALLPKDEYVLFGDHTRFVKYFKGQFAQGADGLKILKAKENITPRYFFYAFDNIEIPTRGYSRHWSIAKELLIPIPSIAEQSRIVGILDTFTTSIDNLKQQIEQRRKQYEYYRDQLLDLEGKEGVEMKTLGEVAKKVSSGKNKSKNINGVYPVFGSTGIIAYSDEYVFDKPLILVARVGANAGYVHLSYGKYDVTDNTLMVDLNDCIVYQKYIYHNLIRENINKYAKGGGQPLITSSILKSIIIPVPSLEEQSRIVGILDTFEASMANLEQQLEMREKQYEYYRNQLLTFE